MSEGDPIVQRCLARTWRQTPDGPLVELGIRRLRIRYAPADPWAAALEFSDGTRRCWTCSRELLSDGLTGPAGVGAVHLQPGSETSRRCVWLSLRGSDAHYELRIGESALAYSVRHMYARVPAGHEHAHVDWLGEFAALEHSRDEDGV